MSKYVSSLTNISPLAPSPSADIGVWDLYGLLYRFRHLLFYIYDNNVYGIDKTYMK